MLASACLPTLFPAVEVDGEAYWDGGYMLAETPTLDLMLVQVHPSARSEVPLGGAAVLDRINEITFHGSLVKELRSLAILRKLIHDEGLADRPFHEPLFRKAAALRVHRIEGGEKLDALASAGLLYPAWHRLLELHRAGHAAADTWLTDHFTHLGRHGTWWPTTWAATCSMGARMRQRRRGARRARAPVQALSRPAARPRPRRCRRPPAPCPTAACRNSTP